MVGSWKPCDCNHRPAVVAVPHAAVPEAGDELSSDKVGGRAVVHGSRIIRKSAAPLLRSCRREELNRVAGRWWVVASYDEDSWGGFWSIVSYIHILL